MAHVTALVRRRCELLGEAGHRWLVGLDELLGELQAQWDCRIDQPLGAATTAYVARTIDREGRPAVLKVAIPAGGEGYTPFEQEASVLTAAAGRSYVEIRQIDAARRAMLLEPLGPSLDSLDLSVPTRITILAETMRSSWRLPDQSTRLLPTGRDQAVGLAQFIEQLWDTLDHPCDRRVIERALTYVERRRDAFDIATAVVIHGDAHPSNVLVDETNSGFKMIDPQGLISEPAHDLAIPLRGWSTELASDPTTLVDWCHTMAATAGIEPVPIWEWAFVERVSTGLLLHQLGDPLGEQYIAIATALRTTNP